MAPFDPELSGALMVCGTSSGAGKSTIVTGLCRLVARAGIDAVPFKAQNMSNNAAVCDDGAEIGRAQFAQAQAAGVAACADMNPILVKPLDAHRAQLVVLGRPAGTMTALETSVPRPELFDTVVGALGRLRHEHAVVVVEGAGSPAELNLLDRDLANLPLADRTQLPVIVVADVDRGGMLAAAYGTVALLPPHLRGGSAGSSSTGSAATWNFCDRASASSSNVPVSPSSGSFPQSTGCSTAKTASTFRIPWLLGAGARWMSR
jgi:adenosylcobyric acid synthase